MRAHAKTLEWYADALREMSEKAGVPVDFLPHHANLSREHRVQLEENLKTQRTTTAVCTSTLDLGNNQLTGRIPESLGYLTDLTTLRLSGNSFGGCIPSALRDVTTNDLNQCQVGCAFGVGRQGSWECCSSFSAP